MTSNDTRCDEVFDGVRQCLAEALGVSPDSIQPGSKIIDELGADSLDLLDITFRLERHFKIKISPRDIERRAKARLGDTPMEIDGVYTTEALVELRKALPEVPPEELAEGLTMAMLPRRFRVATMMNLVRRCQEDKSD